jgi:threonine/homoserine/homoserine lactone efflux protein
MLALARQEFLVAAGNPKAILIFTAFLPQFVDATRAITLQFAVLGALFLILEWIAIAAYAYMGLHMRRWFAKPSGKPLQPLLRGAAVGGGFGVADGASGLSRFLFMALSISMDRAPRL